MNITNSFLRVVVTTVTTDIPGKEIDAQISMSISLSETFVVNVATTTLRNEFVMFVLDPYGT